MITPQAQALALEGAWRIEFDGVQLEPVAVTIENRSIVGGNDRYRITGDFRIIDGWITAFVRVRYRRGHDTEEVLVEARGAYGGVQLALTGSTIGPVERAVRIELKR